MNKIRYILTLFAFLYVAGNLKAQIFTVTNTADLNVAGCLRYELAAAIAYANTHSAAVKLQLNASGYCQVASALPTIAVTLGTLEITKDPGAAASTQGVIVTNTSSSFNLFEVVGSTSTVKISELHLEGKITGNDITAKIVYGYNSDDILVLDCHLSKAKDLIYTDQVHAASIQNSTLEIVPSSNISLSYTGISYIRNPSANVDFSVGVCNFVTNTTQNTTAVYLSGASAVANNAVKINYNTISNYTKGLNLDFVPTTGSGSILQIYNNDLTCTEECIYLVAYDNNAVDFHDNTFHCPKTDIHFVGVNSPNQTFYIIETNPYGYPLTNSGNVFSTNNDGSAPQILCEGRNYYHLILIGLKLSGQIQVDGATSFQNHVWFQGGQIIKNATTSNIDLPITLTNGGNSGISKPAITSKSVTSNTLTVNYTYPTTATTGLSFDFDFYKSNAEGDLVDYIGTQRVNSISAGTYTASLVVPSGVSLTSGDRVAMTITWIGATAAIPFYSNTHSAVQTLGTSEVAYSSSSDCIQSITTNLNSSYNAALSSLFASNSTDPNWNVYSVGTSSPPFTQGSYSLHPTVMVHASVFSNTFSNSEWLTVTDPVLAASQYLLFSRQFTKLASTINTLDLQLRANEDARVYLNGTLVYETCHLTTSCTSTYFSYNEPAPSTVSLPNSAMITGQNLLQVLLITPTGSPTTPAFDAIVTLHTCVITSDDLPCENCIGSFQPEPDKTYLISAWVREDGASGTATVFSNPEIYIDFTTTGSPVTVGPVSATADARCHIIDGWQQIERSFTVPSTATNMSIRLQCASGDCLYDDIRVIPYDGSMKSFVYDPINLRLVAELDERNFATFYEYDEEGKLVRVKKETEKGIMTIKESRESRKKR